MLDAAPYIRETTDMAKKTTKKRAAFSDQIRQAILSAGVTRYRIAKECGIDQAVLSKFARGERGISLEALDALGVYLDLQVIRHGPKGE